MLERIEKFKHFFTTFLRGAFGLGAGSWYLRGTLRALIAAEPTLMRGSRPAGVVARRWGVVQLVGHLTVNEDGEGSNPSAPAKFSSRKSRPSARFGADLGAQWICTRP